MWCESSMEMRNLLQCISPEVSNAEEKSSATDQIRFMDKHIDVVSLYPEAFMDDREDGPRPLQKPKDTPKLQVVLGSNVGTFIMHGYPDLRMRKLR